jgi:hypothetical protein
MSQEQKAYFTIKDGKIIPVVSETYKEVTPEPKKRHVRNRPGHVRPLRKKRR